MMTQKRLLEILEDLSEIRLDLIDLTWQFLDDQGRLDEKKIAFHNVEVEKAVSQAETYTSATKKILHGINLLL